MKASSLRITLILASALTASASAGISPAVTVHPESFDSPPVRPELAEGRGRLTQDRPVEERQAAAPTLRQQTDRTGLEEALASGDPNRVVGLVKEALSGFVQSDQPPVDLSASTGQEEGGLGEDEIREMVERDWGPWGLRRRAREKRRRAVGIPKIQARQTAQEVLSAAPVIIPDPSPPQRRFPDFAFSGRQWVKAVETGAGVLFETGIAQIPMGSGEIILLLRGRRKAPYLLIDMLARPDPAAPDHVYLGRLDLHLSLGEKACWAASALPHGGEPFDREEAAGYVAEQSIDHTSALSMFRRSRAAGEETDGALRALYVDHDMVWNLGMSSDDARTALALAAVEVLRYLEASVLGADLRYLENGYFSGLGVSPVQAEVSAEATWYPLEPVRWALREHFLGVVRLDGQAWFLRLEQSTLDLRQDRLVEIQLEGGKAVLLLRDTGDVALFDLFIHRGEEPPYFVGKMDITLNDERDFLIARDAGPSAPFLRRANAYIAQHGLHAEAGEMLSRIRSERPHQALWVDGDATQELRLTRSVVRDALLFAVLQTLHDAGQTRWGIDLDAHNLSLDYRRFLERDGDSGLHVVDIWRSREILRKELIRSSIRFDRQSWVSETTDRGGMLWRDGMTAVPIHGGTMILFLRRSFNDQILLLDMLLRLAARGEHSYVGGIDLFFDDDAEAYVARSSGSWCRFSEIASEYLDGERILAIGRSSMFEALRYDPNTEGAVFINPEVRHFNLSPDRMEDAIALALLAALPEDQRKVGVHSGYDNGRLLFVGRETAAVYEQPWGPGTGDIHLYDRDSFRDGIEQRFLSAAGLEEGIPKDELAQRILDAPSAEKLWLPHPISKLVEVSDYRTRRDGLQGMINYLAERTRSNVFWLGQDGSELTVLLNPPVRSKRAPSLLRSAAPPLLLVREPAKSLFPYTRERDRIILSNLKSPEDWLEVGVQEVRDSDYIMLTFRFANTILVYSRDRWEEIWKEVERAGGIKTEQGRQILIQRRGKTERVWLRRGGRSRRAQWVVFDTSGDHSTWRQVAWIKPVHSRSSQAELHFRIPESVKLEHESYAGQEEGKLEQDIEEVLQLSRERFLKPLFSWGPIIRHPETRIEVGLGETELAGILLEHPALVLVSDRDLDAFGEERLGWECAEWTRQVRKDLVARGYRPKVVNLKNAFWGEHYGVQVRGQVLAPELAFDSSDPEVEITEVIPAKEFERSFAAPDLPLQGMTFRPWGWIEEEAVEIALLGRVGFYRQSDDFLPFLLDFYPDDKLAIHYKGRLVRDGISVRETEAVLRFPLGELPALRSRLQEDSPEHAAELLDIQAALKPLGSAADSGIASREQELLEKAMVENADLAYHILTKLPDELVSAAAGQEEGIPKDELAQRILDAPSATRVWLPRPIRKWLPIQKYRNNLRGLQGMIHHLAGTTGHREFWLEQEGGDLTVRLDLPVRQVHERVHVLSSTPPLLLVGEPTKDLFPSARERDRFFLRHFNTRGDYLEINVEGVRGGGHVVLAFRAADTLLVNRSDLWGEIWESVEEAGGIKSAEGRQILLDIRGKSEEMWLVRPGHVRKTEWVVFDTSGAYSDWRQIARVYPLRVRPPYLDIHFQIPQSVWLEHKPYAGQEEGELEAARERIDEALATLTADRSRSSPKDGETTSSAGFAGSRRSLAFQVIGESVSRQYPAVELLDRIGPLQHVKLDPGGALSDLLAEQLARKGSNLGAVYYGSERELRNFGGYARERGLSVKEPNRRDWRLSFELLLGGILQNLTGRTQREIESQINFPQLVKDLKLLGDA